MGSKTHMGRTFALALALTLGLNALIPSMADAGALTNTYLRLGRMSAATTTSVRLVFSTSPTVATEDNIRINFNGTDATQWTTAGAVNATQTASSASCAAETGATAVPGILTAAGATGVVTISGVTNLTASTAYCVDLTSATAVTTPAAGEFHPIITTQASTTVIDQAIVALRVVSNDSITVTANVPPTFNFQLDSNTTAFTTDLTPGTKTQTTARTFTVNTNAKVGWVAWLRNADTNGLYSAGVAKDIAPTTPGTAVNVDAAPSTEQYVWGASALSQGTGAGTTTLSAAYDATGATNDGSGVDNSYRAVATSNGTAASAVVTLTASATISGITPAASDYTDIIQVIGAGNF